MSIETLSTTSTPPAEEAAKPNRFKQAWEATKDAAGRHEIGKHSLQLIKEIGVAALVGSEIVTANDAGGIKPSYDGMRNALVAPEVAAANAITNAWEATPGAVRTLITEARASAQAAASGPGAEVTPAIMLEAPMIDAAQQPEAGTAQIQKA